MLPAYITQTKPNPASNRAPWFTNTAPTYAGVFLWIVFYQTMAQGTIDRASLGVCIAALVGRLILCLGVREFARDTGLGLTYEGCLALVVRGT
jgi:cytosine permease